MNPSLRIPEIMRERRCSYTEAHDTYCEEIAQQRRASVIWKLELALLANGGGYHDPKMCECDPDTNQCPCRYCAIHDAITSALAYLR